jgi:hypothetical protein
MHRARHSFLVDPGPPSAAVEQQRERHSAEPDADRETEITTVHGRRMALLATISAGVLAKLNASIRQGIASNNGTRSCRRLASGDVECACDYCEQYWSRLEEKLTAHL